MTRDNKLLGMLRLEGIPPQPAGMPQIVVTFDVLSLSGVLDVKAEIKSTGCESRVTIQGGSFAASEEDIAMLRDASAFALKLSGTASN